MPATRLHAVHTEPLNDDDGCPIPGGPGICPQLHEAHRTFAKQFSALEARVEQIDKSVAQRVDDVREDMDARLTTVEKHVDARVDGLSKHVDTRVDALETHVTDRMDAMVKHVDTTVGGLQSALLAQLQADRTSNEGERRRNFWLTIVVLFIFGALSLGGGEISGFGGLMKLGAPNPQPAQEAPPAVVPPARPDETLISPPTEG